MLNRRLLRKLYRFGFDIKKFKKDGILETSHAFFCVNRKKLSLKIEIEVLSFFDWGRDYHKKEVLFFTLYSRKNGDGIYPYRREFVANEAEFLSDMKDFFLKNDLRMKLLNHKWTWRRAQLTSGEQL